MTESRTEGAPVDQPHPVIVHTRNVWFTAANPDTLLDIVWRRKKEFAVETTLRDSPPAKLRRLRLYGCACARMVWDLLPTDARSAVAISERFAEGRASEQDLRAAEVRLTRGPVAAHHHATNAAGRAATGFWEPPPAPDWGRTGMDPADAALSATKALACRAAGPAPRGGSPVSPQWEAAYNAAFAAARAHQAELVRDIYAPPANAFGPQRLEREWLTSTVLTLARQADEASEYGVLPILADALQDAGCDNEFILARCRAESGIHSRGNWVVDLLLGRE
jgi:hypothetical protein